MNLIRHLSVFALLALTVLAGGPGGGNEGNHDVRIRLCGRGQGGEGNKSSRLMVAVVHGAGGNLGGGAEGNRVLS